MANEEEIAGDDAPNAKTGPKHAKPRRFTGTAREQLTELSHVRSSEAGSIEGLLKKNEFAKPGDYESILDTTSFRLSRMVRKAAPYIEQGNFEAGVADTLDRIKNRSIQIEYIPKEYLNKLTRLDVLGDDSRSVMILPDDFDEEPPEMQLWELLRRNMELIIQRQGNSLLPANMTDIYKMGVAYARTLRLSTEDKREGRAMVKVNAKLIEDWAVEKLEQFQ
jgi:hypothetical protein